MVIEVSLTADQNEQGQRTPLDSLDPPDAEEVNAKRVVTKVGRGAGKPVRHSLQDTYTGPAGTVGGGAAGQWAGTFLAGHRPELGHVPGGRQKVCLGGESTYQTLQRQRVGQGRAPGPIANGSQLTRVTFSLDNNTFTKVVGHR